MFAEKNKRNKVYPCKPHFSLYSGVLGVADGRCSLHGLVTCNVMIRVLEQTELESLPSNLLEVQKKIQQLTSNVSPQQYCFNVKDTALVH